MVVEVRYVEPGPVGVIVVDDDPPLLTSPERLVGFSVAGRDARPVVLVELRAVAVGSREPRPAYRVPDADPPVPVEWPEALDYSVDLVPGEARVAEVAWRGDPELPVPVTAADPRRFTVVGRPEHVEVEWRLELDWTTSDGRRGTVTIDDGGRPFHSYPHFHACDGPPPAHLHAFLAFRSRPKRSACS